MQDLSLHILDITENAVRADAKNISIEVFEDTLREELIISIKDDGRGMNEDMRKKALDPFFTTKDGKRIGLGLSLFAQAAQDTGGTLKINSELGQGTIIRAIFKLNSPDLKPVGDILETLASLITAYPAIRFVYDYKKGDDKYHFDSCVDCKK
ncbi:MAG TPA: ATP-binding protein [Candidatus Omnitrophica bacterium]|nr:ATP-binding protein [Candidatus Omnitrophota bacterium]